MQNTTLTWLSVYTILNTMMFLKLQISTFPVLKSIKLQVLRRASEHCHWTQLCWFCRFAIQVHTVRKIWILPLSTIQQMLAHLMYTNSCAWQHAWNMKRCFKAKQLQHCISALAPYHIYTSFTWNYLSPLFALLLNGAQDSTRCWSNSKANIAAVRKPTKIRKESIAKAAKMFSLKQPSSV